MAVPAGGTQVAIPCIYTSQAVPDIQFLKNLVMQIKINLDKNINYSLHKMEERAKDLG